MISSKILFSQKTKRDLAKKKLVEPSNPPIEKQVQQFFTEYWNEYPAKFYTQEEKSKEQIRN